MCGILLLQPELTKTSSDALFLTFVVWIWMDLRDDLLQLHHEFARSPIAVYQERPLQLGDLPRVTQLCGELPSIVWVVCHGKALALTESERHWHLLVLVHLPLGKQRTETVYPGNPPSYSSPP